MVSIIVPTLNEEKTIENTVNKLLKLKGNKEIIIVDGNSIDNTVKIANRSNVKVVKSERGRSNQMNTGASFASGDILWFVHSDSIIKEDSIIKINECINKGYVGGGFNLYFYDLKTLFMKFVEITSNIRGKHLKLIYGDQGIFVKKDIFEILDGFPKQDLMEDWDFSIKMKKYGKTTLLKTKIGTSGRRFEKGGQVKTLLLMHKIKVMHMMGVENKKIAKMYREAR